MPRTRYHVEETELRPDAAHVKESPVGEPPALRGDVDRVLRSLASAPADVRGRQLGWLQRTGGNAAIARAIAERVKAGEAAPSGAAGAMETRSETLNHTFTAVIRRAKPAPGSSAGPSLSAVAGAFSDSMAGAEHGTTPEQAAAAVGVPADAAAPAPGAAPAPETAHGGEAAEGEAPAPKGEAAEEAPVSLPDIPLQGAKDITLCDAMWPWVGYDGLVAHAGAAPGPSEFGVTRPGNMTLKNITVWRVLGRFFVKATLEQHLDWQVRVGLGPTGEQNVGSALDPVITRANYAAVAADLTPNMGDLGGRPPRNAFWAQDLTEQHEKFHADDAKGRGPAAVSVGSAWLGTQQAIDVPGVQALLNQVPGRAFTALMAAMGMPGREIRAYGDGAGAYGRRALAIKALGAVGWYS